MCVEHNQHCYTSVVIVSLRQFQSIRQSIWISIHPSIDLSPMKWAPIHCQCSFVWKMELSWGWFARTRKQAAFVCVVLTLLKCSDLWPKQIQELLYHFIWFHFTWLAQIELNWIDCVHQKRKIDQATSLFWPINRHMRVVHFNGFGRRRKGELGNYMAAANNNNNKSRDCRAQSWSTGFTRSLSFASCSNWTLFSALVEIDAALLQSIYFNSNLKARKSISATASEGGGNGVH